MSIVSYFCVFLLLSSLIARINSSSGEVVVFMFKQVLGWAHFIDKLYRNSSG